LEKTAMNNDSQELRAKLDVLKQEVATLRRLQPRGLRKRSNRLFFGLPLYDIAMGPDPEAGEMRGHACGIVAIGDIATGVIALGGIARGGIAVGGLALGLLSLGGCSVGVLLAIGGLALSIGCAIGGLAIGLVAIGGGAIGYYAIGGEAVGKYVISATTKSPEAVAFFTRWIPWPLPR
jgi:hypothetical protein